MRVAGIAVKMTGKGRPTIRLAVLNDQPSLSVEQCEDFSSDHTDLAEQLHDSAEAIRSRMKGLAVDRVVVRIADRAPVPANKPGPRIRLLTEGAIISAARSVVVDTHVGSGKELGAEFGSIKATLDAAAAALATQQGLSSGVYTEAIAAALATLRP